MRLQLNNETELEIDQFEQDGFDIHLKNEGLYFGAMPLFVTSLARCTFAVLESYSMRLNVEAKEIQMKLVWQYAKKPTRISTIEMQILWKSLPESRLRAVEKAAHLCTIHNTIHNCVDITTSVMC